MQSESLRDLVTTWREQTGLGIDDLARLVGVHRCQVYRWLEGATQPASQHLDVLRRVLRRRLAVLAAAIDETTRRKESQLA